MARWRAGCEPGYSPPRTRACLICAAPGWACGPWTADDSELVVSAPDPGVQNVFGWVGDAPRAPVDGLSPIASRLHPTTGARWDPLGTPYPRAHAPTPAPTYCAGRHHRAATTRHGVTAGVEDGSVSYRV